MDSSWPAPSRRASSSPTPPSTTSIAAGWPVSSSRARGALPSGLGPGSTVDVWAARELERGAYEPPAVLVANAEVAAIREPEGMVDSGGASVELLIPREKVAALLEGLTAGDAIDLVPARATGD